MQVILLEKVANLGNLGDIVKVRDGFGRNFLIPQRKAKRATETNKAEFEAKRADLEKAAAAQLVEAQATATKLDGMMVQITEKAGVDGRLFGSVTNFNIAEALAKQGFVVEKSQIRMPNGMIKTVGDVDIAVQLHTDVVANIKVSVLGDHA
ncbi:MAG TPA: 50S ribosomal protein L9 [Burkholderiales bacterium]|jgi:large subunit ribosomal protein L9|nr:50S ribosomal protein L9 [Burkholderiales bacterium]